MATIKKSSTKLAKAQDGYKARQGNYPKEEGTPPNSFPVAKVAETKPAPAETFGQAFARERKAGAKTFTWKGKSYTTQTKEDVAKKATPAKSTAAAATSKSTPVKSTTPGNPLPRTGSGHNPPESFNKYFPQKPLVTQKSKVVASTNPKDQQTSPAITVTAKKKVVSKADPSKRFKGGMKGLLGMKKGGVVNKKGK